MAEGFGEAPPAVRLLGFALTGVDAERGEVEATFDATPQFLNSMGTVQGGFLAAMLDAALGAAIGCTLPAGVVAPTLELKVSYLRPATAGRLTGRGRVVHRGSSIAFLDGELRNGDGEILATATSTARLIVVR
jgi:uncharacterized protein (TIGR00369 family)